MRDDELMDQLLKDGMAGDTPELSSAFDARLMRRIRRRQLTPLGRLAMSIYIVVAGATMAWLMRDWPVQGIVTAVGMGVAIAAASAAYGRRLLSQA